MCFKCWLNAESPSWHHDHEQVQLCVCNGVLCNYRSTILWMEWLWSASDKLHIIGYEYSNLFRILQLEEPVELPRRCLGNLLTKKLTESLFFTLPYHTLKWWGFDAEAIWHLFLRRNSILLPIVLLLLDAIANLTIWILSVCLFSALFVVVARTLSCLFQNHNIEIYRPVFSNRHVLVNQV